MTNTLSYIIQINSNFEKVTASFNTFQSKVHIGIDKIQKQLNSVNMNAMIQNISSAADGLSSLNDPGIKLSSSLADLSAIAGVTGKGLKEIEGYARDNAKTFGGSAAEGVEAYKLLLSQLTPEIAKQPKALEAMGNSVATLSKTMGGDTVAATEVLTTAMNQYQVSMTDPIRASRDMSTMMNIMAASAKEGSAELPQIKSALEQSGLAAKTANVSFAETNAAIQVLDKAGKKGAEGGVALRNVMATLSEGRFLPKEVKAELASAGVDINKLGDRSKSLKERLEPLKKIMNDQALVTKLFGKENNAAAIALISGSEEMGRLTGVVQGTKTAYEQAAIIMETPLEKNKRLQAQIDDFKISLFNSTSGWLGYADVMGKTAQDFSNLMPIFSGAGKVFTTLTSKTKLQALWTGVLTKVQGVFNLVMSINPIALVVIAITALVAIIVVAINKYDEWGAALLQFMGPIGWVVNGFKSIYDHWESIKNAFQTGGMVAGLKRLGVVLLDVFLKPLQQGLQVLGFDGMASKVEKIRSRMNLVTPGEKLKQVKTENKISEASLPGTDFGKGGANLQGSAAAAQKMKKSNEAVATGGTKHNYFTIHIKEINGLKDVVISAKDAAQKAGDEVADGLIRVLAMATTATGA